MPPPACWTTHETQYSPNAPELPLLVREDDARRIETVVGGRGRGRLVSQEDQGGGSVAEWDRRRRRMIFMVVIVVAVVSAAWFLWGRTFNKDLVDGPVSGAALVWHPGMNSGGPEQRTDANAAEAMQLAELVNDTRNLPQGSINCPADFGSTVRVTFHRPNQKDRAVTIALSGCAGPPGRIMSDALHADLERLAPPGYWPQRLT